MYALVANTTMKILLLHSLRRASEPVVAEETEKKATKNAKKSTAKVAKKAKPVHYSGNKVIETTASSTETQQLRT